MTPTLRSALSLLSVLPLAFAASCDGDGGGSEDILVTVQETNVDDTRTPTCSRNLQQLSATRSCDSQPVAFWVCSDEALCAAQLSEVQSQIESCEIDLESLDEPWAPMTEC